MGTQKFVAGTRGPLWDKGWLQKVQHLGIPFLANGKPNTKGLDNFKAADKAYRANQGIQHFVGHNQKIAIALEM